MMDQADSQDRVKWVRVASFADSGSAHVAKLQLEAEEIPSYLDNEHSSATLWHIQPAVGGVRVCVPEEYEEEAREILARPAEEEPEEDDYEQGEELSYATLDRCPKCHSTDTEELSWTHRVMQTGIIIMIGSVLLVHPWAGALLIGYAVYFLLTKPSHRCLQCRHRFTARPQG